MSCTDSAAGYDFLIDDARGLLLGDGRPRRVMLEVKGCAGAYADAGGVHLSANQIAKRDQVRVRTAGESTLSPMSGQKGMPGSPSPRPST